MTTERSRQPSASRSDTTDWQWQLRNRIHSADDAGERLGLSARQRAGLSTVAERYPIAITPYYFGLIDANDPADPIRRQCLPCPSELNPATGLSADPFGERHHTAACGIIRRYRNRAVFLAHDDCAVHCRHCTRKNSWLARGHATIAERVEAAVATIRRIPDVSEIILSGGDPLLLPTSVLDWMIAAFRAVPHIKVIRIGTRVPVTLPMRIDRELCRMLAHHRPVWVNTHFNHPRELTDMAVTACDRLIRRGIPVSNQTVLLRGVNDRVETLQTLCEMLFRIMVRPYYLFDADPVRGTAHLRVSRRRGRALYTRLQGSLSGLALPRYAADEADLPHKRMLA